MDFTKQQERLEKRTRNYAAEQWLKDHEEANACVTTEKRLAYRIWLYHAVSAWEKFWVDRVATGRWPYREDEARLILGVWEWWQKPCGAAKQSIEYFRARRYDVGPADEFLTCCDEISSRDVMEDLQDIAEISEALKDTTRISHANLKKTIGLD